MFSSCTCVIVKVRICKHACFYSIKIVGKLDGNNSQFKKAFHNLRVCCKTNKKTRKVFYNIAANEFKATLRVCSTTNLKQIKLLQVVESSSITPFCQNVL